MKMTQTFLLLLHLCAAFSADEVSPDVHIAFEVQPGPFAGQEHYAHVFLVSGRAKVAEAYTDFKSPVAVKAGDGHYVLMLLPVTIPESLSAISGSFPCEIARGMTTAVKVTPVQVRNTTIVLGHADGSPIAHTQIDATLATGNDYGCIVDSMYRFTSDAMGRFCLPAVPGERYQLRTELIEFVQRPVVDSPILPISMYSPTEITVHLNRLPEIDLRFIAGNHDPLKGVASVTVHGIPNGRHIPFPLPLDGIVRVLTIHDLTQFDQAMSLEFIIPGLECEPSSVPIIPNIGKTVTIDCHPSINGEPRAAKPKPAEINLPMIVQVLDDNQKVRMDGALSLMRPSDDSANPIEILPFTKTIDGYAITAPVGAAYLLFSVLINDREALFRKKVAVLSGGRYQLAIISRPHGVNVHLANIGSELLDIGFPKSVKYTFLDSASFVFSGYAKPLHNDPGSLVAALYPGSYRLIIEGSHDKAFELGSVVVPEDNSGEIEIVFDAASPKLIPTRIYVGAAAKDLQQDK